MEPIRNILRQKKGGVRFYEAEATKIDYEKRVVYISDDSEIKGEISHTEVPFDMLVVGVGAENATFGMLTVRFLGDRGQELMAVQVSRVSRRTLAS